jgi:hypothetical protein
LDNFIIGKREERRGELAKKAVVVSQIKRRGKVAKRAYICSLCLYMLTIFWQAATIAIYHKTSSNSSSSGGRGLRNMSIII